MPDIDIIIKATDNASGPLKDVNSELGKMDGHSKGLTGPLGTLSNMLGVTLKASAIAATAALVGLGAVLKSSIGAAANMEQGVADIQSIMGNTAPPVEELNKLIQDLGLDPKLKVSATEAAAAINMLARNGVSWDDIQGGMARSTILLANATNDDFALAADVATNAMVQFNKDASEMEEVINGIIGVTQSSQFDINDYALAIAQAGGFAGSVGVEFEDFNAILAATSSSFSGGSDAGTSFKTFLQRLVPDTKSAKEAMRDLGLLTDEGGNAFFTASGEMESASVIAGALAKATAGLSDEQKILAFTNIFGTDAMRTALAVAEGGAGAIDALKASIGDTSAAEAAATRMDTLKGSWEIFTGIVETLSIQLGSQFLPVARDLVEWATKMATEHGPKVIEWATNLADAIKKFFPVLLNFVTNELPNWRTRWGDWAMAAWQWITEKALPPVLQKLGEWGNAVWGWVTANLPTWKAKLAEWATAAWQWIVDVTPIAVAKLVELGNNLYQTLQGWGARFGPVATILWNTLNGAFLVGQELMQGNWQGAWAKLKLTASVIWPQIVDLVGQHLPAWKAKLGEWATATWQWIVDVTPTVITKLGEWAGKLWEWITTNAPTWGTKLGEWAKVAWEWIVKVTPIAVEKLGEWAGKLWEWITTNAPKWGEKLGEWGTELWQWIKDAHPETATKLEGWWGVIKTWIDEHQPLLETYMADWREIIGTLFGTETQTKTTQTWDEWWAALWPKMQEADTQTQLMSKEWEKHLWEWIGDAVPKAIRAFTDYLVDAIGGGLSPKNNSEGQAALDQAQKDLEEAIGKALDNVGWAIIVGAQSVGWKIIDGIVSGITGQEQITKTERGMEEVDERIKQQMLDDFGIQSPSSVFRGFGEMTLQGFIDGANNMIGPVGTKMGEVVSAAKILFADPINWLYQKGVDAVQGFLNGIGSMIGAAQSKVTELGNLAADALGLSLDAQSPSKVFRQYGEWAGQGFVNGMDSRLGDVRAKATEMAQIAIQSAKDIAASNAANYQRLTGMTAPAGVDPATAFYSQESAIDSMATNIAASNAANYQRLTGMTAPAGVDQATAFYNGMSLGGYTSTSNSKTTNFTVNVQSSGDAVRDIRNQVELYALTFGAT